MAVASGFCMREPAWRGALNQIAMTATNIKGIFAGCAADIGDLNGWCVLTEELLGTLIVRNSWLVLVFPLAVSASARTERMHDETQATPLSDTACAANTDSVPLPAPLSK